MLPPCGAVGIGGNGVVRSMDNVVFSLVVFCGVLCGVGLGVVCGVANIDGAFGASRANNSCTLQRGTGKIFITT